MEHVVRIAEFVFKSFIHIWPYLLVTVPLAVIINLSGLSNHINRAFSGKPLLSVLLATCVGAFSPFCSCGVIPVITSLLTGGVPLAPVMSFWIASPSMDPEIFFLSSSVLGWKLAIWRLVSTFIISLAAGYITHLLYMNGYIRTDEILSIRKDNPITTMVTGDVTCSCSKVNWKKKILSETSKATLLVSKFMGLAFLITAIITFYVPENFINIITKGTSITQVVIATLVGIPAYTSNLTALPLVGSLIQSGLSGGAALGFLIAGATTTLPAMIAVRGIASRKVFLLYIFYIISGSMFTGLLFNLLG